ncbi:MAG: EAL domain-containing protein [Rehaibacterium terrae]|jgi:diguanylate cyclase (GGDEF)-like protein/PAS domain S-box-containing protein|uniref:sensor domain-containing protein n=1 Tax=Rehaibacterium terrae TaxID=1341696 RepID=UPI00391C662F
MDSRLVASPERRLPEQALVALDLCGRPALASPHAQPLLLPEVMAELRPAIGAAMAQLRAHPERIVHWKQPSALGPLECRLLGARDDAGQPRGFLLSVAPATAGGSTRDAVVHGRWDEAVEHLEDGLWDWDAESGCVRRSPRWLSMLGYGEGELGPALDEVFALIHPDDRAGLRIQLDRLLAGGVTHYVSEHRLRHRDGSWRWILDRGKVVAWRPDGRPQRVVGTQTDISAYKALQERLSESELLLREAQRVAGLGSWAWEADSGRVWWSEEMFRIAALPPERGAPTLEQQRALYPAESYARLREALGRLLHRGEPCDLELDLHRGDGELRHLVVRAERLCDAGGRVVRLLGVVQDVTEQRRAHEAMRWQSELLNRISAMGRIGGFELDLDSGLVHFTDQACRIHGLPAGEAIALEQLRALYDPNTREAIDGAIRAFREPGQSIELSGALTTPDGRRIWVQTIGELECRDGRPWRITGLIRDITVEREADERIRRLAHFDSLTGLPTRAAFRQQALEAVAASEDGLALLFIDLDRFKLVNEAMGHLVGDEVLRVTAERLRGCVHGGGMVGRHGGDEFLVLLRGIQQPEDAAAVARRIIDALSQPLTVAGNELQVGCSVGIALSGPRGADLDELLRAADAAMSRAKDAGRNTCQFHDVAQFERVQRRIGIERQLRGALERSEFSLAYQPAVSLRDGRTLGIEALLRWRPVGGLRCGPDEFVPVAEETGEIVRIGDWVLAEACRQARAWDRAGLRFGHIAVNASAVQMRDPQFAERVIAICADIGWPAERLELEITESSMMIDSEALRAGLALLESRGVRLAVDDFGTGFSNLQYLHRFPVSHLKIDRAFTWAMLQDPAVAELTQAIVTLGHALGLRVIAEGVETEAMAELLRGQGCDEAQGYLYSRPLTAEALTAWLRARD